MKGIIVLLCLMLFFGCLLAQDKDPVKLDMLKAPTSPAANLLGFATTDIDKPTDISAFMLSLQSATTSFTKLPSNYAVDIAPFLVSGKKNSDLTTTGLQSTDFRDVFKQTFVLSAAIRNPDSTDKNFNPKSAYTAFGFKFSILRGDYDDETKNSLNAISDLQNEVLAILQKAAKKYKNTKDPVLAQLKLQLRNLVAGKDSAELVQIVNSAEYKNLENSIADETEKKLTAIQMEVAQQEFGVELSSLTDRIKKIAASFQTNRVGLTWDMNGGISTEFRNKKFDNSKIYNAGLWQTIGYTDKKGSSLLGLIRFLYNPDKIFAKDNAANTMDNISTFDFGMRYAYSKPQSKFSCSAEGIRRSVLSSNTIDPSWRFIFNADYSIFENQKLTFTFGRSFDGTITKDGNLIAALSFLTGLGNKR